MAAMTSKPELMQAATAAAIRYVDGERDSRVAPARDAELPADLDSDFLSAPWPADDVLQLLSEAGGAGRGYPGFLWGHSIARGTHPLPASPIKGEVPFCVYGTI